MVTRLLDYSLAPGEVSSLALCGRCFDIALDPMKPKDCSECVFCDACITQLRADQRCAHNKPALPLLPAPDILRIAHRVRLRCPGAGCRQVMDASLFLHHCKNCSFLEGNVPITAHERGRIQPVIDRTIADSSASDEAPVEDDTPKEPHESLELFNLAQTSLDVVRDWIKTLGVDPNLFLMIPRADDRLWIRSNPSTNPINDVEILWEGFTSRHFPYIRTPVADDEVPTYKFTPALGFIDCPLHGLYYQGECPFRHRPNASQTCRYWKIGRDCVGGMQCPDKHPPVRLESLKFEPMLLGRCKWCGEQDPIHPAWECERAPYNDANAPQGQVSPSASGDDLIPGMERSMIPSSEISKSLAQMLIEILSMEPTRNKHITSLGSCLYQRYPSAKALLLQSGMKLKAFIRRYGNLFRYDTETCLVVLIASPEAVAADGLTPVTTWTLPPPNAINGPTVCRWFLQGGCKKGNRCPFQHDPLTRSRRVCDFYRRTGRCAWGDVCKWSHDLTNALPEYDPMMNYPATSPLTSQSSSLSGLSLSPHSSVSLRLGSSSSTAATSSISVPTHGMSISSASMNTYIPAVRHSRPSPAPVSSRLPPHSWPLHPQQTPSVQLQTPSSPWPSHRRISPPHASDEVSKADWEEAARLLAVPQSGIERQRSSLDAPGLWGPPVVPSASSQVLHTRPFPSSGASLGVPGSISGLDGNQNGDSSSRRVWSSAPGSSRPRVDDWGSAFSLGTSAISPASSIMAPSPLLSSNPSVIGSSSVKSLQNGTHNRSVNDDPPLAFVGADDWSSPYSLAHHHQQSVPLSYSPPYSQSPTLESPPSEATPLHSYFSLFPPTEDVFGSSSLLSSTSSTSTTIASAPGAIGGTNTYASSSSSYLLSASSLLNPAEDDPITAAINRLQLNRL